MASSVYNCYVASIDDNGFSINALTINGGIPIGGLYCQNAALLYEVGDEIVVGVDENGDKFIIGGYGGGAVFGNIDGLILG